jgi:predicted GTPase
MIFGRTEPQILLGTKQLFYFLTRKLHITRQQAHAHMHVLGKTGSGKSYFLAGLFLSMHKAGMPATLIDPHGDLAEMVLSHLIQRGEFQDPQAYDKLVYLDIPAAATTGRYLPFNYLEQPYDDHAMPS